ncbi:DNA primase [Sporolactobacillus inulinus]|uniref:DNA primase n=1 Tax=Sporolactobacillus inulinus TaxID=2078 RepID=A0A4Y1ZBK7_9BACL|nr:DNA primase [Sporolactobacillus inulinus]
MYQSSHQTRKASLIAEMERQRKEAEQSGNYEQAARLLSEIIDAKKKLSQVQAEHD